MHEIESIAVITNVVSGKNRGGRYRKFRLPEIVGKRGEVVETETLEEIDGVIERFVQRGEKLICFNGGDGTLQRALTRMINLYGESNDNLPLIFPLRGGTLNVLADNLQIKGEPDQICSRLVQCIERRVTLSSISIPTLRLKVEVGDAIHHEYGFFFGNGALYRFDRFYYRETKGGPFAAAQLFIRCLVAALLKSTRYRDVFGLTPMRVTVDGFTMPGDSFTIVLAMIFKRVVLTFNPFRDEGDGDFYVLSTSLPFGKMVSRLDRLLWVRGNKQPFPQDVYWNRKASHLVIESSEGYTLDGELFSLDEPYRLTIDRGPEVKVLNPKFL